MEGNSRENVKGYEVKGKVNKKEEGFSGNNTIEKSGNGRYHSQAHGNDFKVRLHFSEEQNDIDQEVIQILKNLYIKNYLAERGKETL